MSKCIKTIPLAQIQRVAVVFGRRRSLAQVKADVGCDYIINGGLYHMATQKPVGQLKVDGTVYSTSPWSSIGYAWDAGPDMEMVRLPDDGGDRQNYINCVALLTPWTAPDDPLVYDRAALGGTRGRTAMAMTEDSLILYCSGDGTAGAATPEKLRAELVDLGAKTALMLDGGGSSQCDMGDGDVIKSGRPVNNYICVWTQHDKEEIPTDGIKTAYMTQNRCYTNRKTIVPKGVMVHSTAAPGIMATSLRGKWDSKAAAKSVHAMVDNLRTLQTLPWTARAWHAGAAYKGGPTANDTHIAFEVCEPQECRLIPVEWVALKKGSKGWAVEQLQRELVARGYDPKGVDGSFGAGCQAAVKKFQRDAGLVVDGSVGKATLAALAKREGSWLKYDPNKTAEYFAAVWDRAVELTAQLCQEYGLDPWTDVLCHQEGYQKKIASNHADVLHWWPLHGKSMDDFRYDVKARMEELKHKVTCPNCGHKFNL